MLLGGKEMRCVRISKGTPDNGTKVWYDLRDVQGDALCSADNWNSHSSHIHVIQQRPFPGHDLPFLAWAGGGKYA